MRDDVFVCGHCGKSMIRDKDKIVYACYKIETGNIHCAYLCKDCFNSVNVVSWSENLDK